MAKTWKYTGRTFDMSEFKFIQIELGDQVGYATLKDDSESMNVVLHPDSAKAKIGIWAEVVRSREAVSE